MDRAWGLRGQFGLESGDTAAPANHDLTGLCAWPAAALSEHGGPVWSFGHLRIRVLDAPTRVPSVHKPHAADRSWASEKPS